MTWIALAYHLASRLAYVLYVGVTLKRQDRAAYLTRRHGPEAAFRRFRRVAAIVMANDAVSLGVLCLVSANTLHLGLPRGLTIAVGAVLDLVRLRVALVRLRDPDADRHRDALPGAPVGQHFLLLFLGAEPGPEDEARLLDGLPQRLEVGEGLLGAPPGEDHRELLAAVAVGLSPPAHLRQLRGDHLEHLIADVVPMLVVDALEVVHVEHRHGVVTAEPQQRLVQRPSGGEPGEAVLVRHVVGGFHHRDDEDERAGGEVERREPGTPGTHRRQADERRDQRPGERASRLRRRRELGCR